jgi:hypothetical protein
MLRILAFSTLILAGAVSVAYADVYRWVDDHGSVHYSDRWVPGSELIKTSRPRSGTSDADAHRAADSTRTALPGMDRGPGADHLSGADRAAEQISQDKAAQAVKQDVAKVRDQQCKDAKERYQKAIQARRIFTTTKDGERQYISDQDADSYRVKARADLQELCGPQAK